MPEQEIFTEEFGEKEKPQPKKEKDDVFHPETPITDDNTEPIIERPSFFSRIRDWAKQAFEKVKETLKDRLPSLNKPGGFLDRVETRVFGGKEAYNKLYIPDDAVVTQKENRISELTKEEPKSKEEKREERDKLQASKQFERYKTLAEKGDIKSCLQLGYCYRRGKVKMGDKTVSIDGLSKDPKLEFEYYKKAFELSNGKEGAIQLGRCYEYGIGTEPDLFKAQDLYTPYENQINAFYKRNHDFNRSESNHSKKEIDTESFDNSSETDPSYENNNQTNVLESVKNLRTIDIFESSVSGRLLTDTEGKEYLYVNHDNENVTVIPIETDENGNSFANPETKLNLSSDRIVSIGQTKNISLESVIATAETSEIEPNMGETGEEVAEIPVEKKGEGKSDKEKQEPEITKATVDESLQPEIEKGDILEGPNGNHYLYTGTLKEEPDKCWLQKVEYDDKNKIWKTTGDRSFEEKVDKLEDYKIEKKTFGDFQKGDEAYDYEGNHGIVSCIKNNIITFKYDSGTELDCFATRLQIADKAEIRIEEMSETPEESEPEKIDTKEKTQEIDFSAADTQEESISLENVKADDSKVLDESLQSLNDVAIE